MDTKLWPVLRIMQDRCSQIYACCLANSLHPTLHHCFPDPKTNTKKDLAGIRILPQRHQLTETTGLQEASEVIWS